MYAVHTGVDMDTQRNILIPLQFKRQLWELESEPAEVEANLYLLSAILLGMHFKFPPPA